MVYSYKHGFSGFAAKLTESQAQRLAGKNDYLFHTQENFELCGIHLACLVYFQSILV